MILPQPAQCSIDTRLFGACPCERADFLSTFTRSSFCKQNSVGVGRLWAGAAAARGVILDRLLPGIESLDEGLQQLGLRGSHVVGLSQVLAEVIKLPGLGVGLADEF